MEKHRKLLDGCVRKVLNEKRATKSSLLDMLVAEELSYEEVSATVVAFIVLGFDRLSTATCAALTEASRDRKQLEQFRAVSFESIESLKPLESFMSECHRRHPPTPIIAKHISQGVPLNGFFIPPQTSCLLLFGAGRDQLKDPDNFDTDRNLSQAFGYRMDVPMMLTAIVTASLTRHKLMMDKSDKVEGIALLLGKEKTEASVKARK
jgi:cytochrome P450